MSPTLNAKTATFQIDRYTLVEDLVWWNGPLLSLYKGPEGDLYLNRWVDVFDGWDRYVFSLYTGTYPMPAVLLYEECVREPKTSIVHDTRYVEGAEKTRAWEVKTKDLPDDYFPEKGCTLGGEE